MARTIKGKIDSWFKGMSDDIRIQDFSSFFLSIHNNIFESIKRIVPFRSTEDNTTDGANEILRRFLYYNSKLYALGQASSASNIAKIYEKSGDVITSGWTASANGGDSAGAADGSIFIQYKGFIYIASAGTRFSAYDPSGGGAFHGNGDVALTVSYTDATCAIVTSDDLLLIAYDNKIAVKDGGSSYNDNWEAARLTLPSSLRIFDLEEYGSLVAITCRPANQNELNSRVFLWDKVSPDVTELFDVGEGDALFSAVLDGELFTLVSVGGNVNVSFINTLVLRKYIGGRTSEIVAEIPTEGVIAESSHSVSSTKIKESNRISFILKTKIDGTTRFNQWTIGKKKGGYPVAITMSQEIANNTQPTTVQGHFKLGSYYFFSYNLGTVVRTTDDNTYTATSTFITQKINGEERVEGASKYRKQLKSATMTFPPLPAGATISLYHRVDSTTSWTKIFDYTTANGLVKQMGTYSDNSDFLIGYEHQFKVTTTGGTALPAEWCSIDYEMDILDADISE